MKLILKLISGRSQKKYEVIDMKIAHSVQATLTIYAHEDYQEVYGERKRPMIVICPGGAYGMTSDREAEAIAVRFMGMGYHAVVLRYSVAPARYPVALRQLAKTVALLRKNSEKWHIEKDKIIVSGFSAGGHLAASLGVFWNTEELAKITEMDNQMIRPDGMILNYPVITSGEFGHEESFRNLLGDRYEELKDQMSLEFQVTEDTPKTFIWHTFEDQTVLLDNTLLFVQALYKKGIPVEYHVFPQGPHGLGLANELTANENGRGIVRACEPWSELAGKWLNREFPWWGGAKIDR